MGSTRATWYCGCGGAHVSGGNTLSAAIAPATTHAALGTSRYARRTSGMTATTISTNGTASGNVERLGPTSTHALSQALRSDLATVTTGWFSARARTPSRRLAGPKYVSPSASRQFSV